MTRPIPVFGAGGRVGGELMKLPTSMRIAPKANGLFGYGASVDITDSEWLALLLAQVKPPAVINLAACTLPRAETELREALAVNTTALFDFHWAPTVHISTDCVFDGAKPTPYTPDDKTNPINFYGMTKRMGEMALAKAPHIIIRTTGVFLRDKPNFLKLVVDKARAGETLTVVEDSIYTPTDARELAKAILMATERVIEDPSVSGTYHFAGPDVMSYLEFARLVQKEAGLSAPIEPTTMAEREKIEGFKRPKNAALNSDKFAEVFGYRHRPTRDCVRELVKPAP